MEIDLREFVRRLTKRLRRVPTAYTIGPPLYAIAVLLLLVSLNVETGVVGTTFTVGAAPPGITERDVSFRATTLFQATLTEGVCGLFIHLLNDTQYQMYQANGSLPAPTLDCNRTEALVHDRVGHLVTEYRAPPNTTANATYVIDVEFFGDRAPYALLSIPGAAVALAVTIWISITVMARGTDRLVERMRVERMKRKRK